MVAVSSRTGRVCQHPDQYDDVDSGDLLHSWCPDCTSVWLISKISPERAAAVRRAVAPWKAARKAAGLSE
jgi:hypothetical protein